MLGRRKPGRPAGVWPKPKRKYVYRKRPTKAGLLAVARGASPDLNGEATTELANLDLEAGMTVADVAAKYGVTRKWVWSRCHAAVVRMIRTQGPHLAWQTVVWLTLQESR